MEGVHAYRHPREHGRHTSECSRLGGVRVNDVRPEPAHGGGQCRQGTQIIGGPYGAAQGWHRADLYMRGPLLHVIGLVRAHEACEEPVVEKLAVEPPMSVETWRAGPPTFIRAMTLITRIREGAASWV